MHVFLVRVRHLGALDAEALLHHAEATGIDCGTVPQSILVPNDYSGADYLPPN